MFRPGESEDLLIASPGHRYANQEGGTYEFHCTSSYGARQRLLRGTIPVSGFGLSLPQPEEAGNDGPFDQSRAPRA